MRKIIIALVICALVIGASLLFFSFMFEKYFFQDLEKISETRIVLPDDNISIDVNRDMTIERGMKIRWEYLVTDPPQGKATLEIYQDNTTFFSIKDSHSASGEFTIQNEKSNYRFVFKNKI